jgi:hypothetical protein
MIGTDWGTIWVVFGALFAFGYLYNLVVAWLERHGYDEGYTAMLVVGGSLATLAGVAVINWRAAALALGAFASSGFWMVVGSWWRHVRRRQRSQEALLDDGTTGMAE